MRMKRLPVARSQAAPSRHLASARAAATAGSLRKVRATSLLENQRLALARIRLPASRPRSRIEKAVSRLEPGKRRESSLFQNGLMDIYLHKQLGSDMRLLRFALSFIVGLSWCSALLCASQAHTVTEIRIPSQEGAEPKFIAAPAGRGLAPVAGLCIDILRAIERVDSSIRFVGEQHWMPLPRIEARLATGAEDAACALQHTIDRDAQFVFLEPSLFPVDYVFVARVDDPVVVNGWNDLRALGPNSTILVNRGFPNIKLLETVGGLQIDSGAGTTTLNLQKLIARR